ncbi:hypothetical protein, partial [Bacillus thuringiensis]|uniref:preprotein translocase subunit SecA n=1 Tax=Bacillus thuringiensis TaxID=1428 RepID=UPI0021B55EEF
MDIEKLLDLKDVGLVEDINEGVGGEVVMDGDRDYVVEEGEMVIVEELSGGVMKGGGYREGLEEGIQGKEGVEI